MPQNTTPAPSYDYPQDLLDAQAALHATRAAYEQYIQASTPADGPEGTQREEELSRFRAELRRLSAEVATHSFWSTLERGTVMEARMTLKHVHARP